ncbi:MAG: DUF192 domain-containing protein [Anaerolineae bacterium]|nr:DUF192 domain-containing protein [Anaerolineae bacterium]
MNKTGRLIKQSTGEVLLDNARWCSSYFCKLRGLMFRRRLEPGEGLILVETGESKMATAIHMLFMAFPIATIWLNTDFEVVDKIEALPWRLYYAPSKPAQYTLEASPDLLERVEIGDRLAFESPS